MLQPETITLYTLEDAQKVIFRHYISIFKKVLKTVILTALTIAFGVAVMCLIEGTAGVFIIIVGLAAIYKN